MTTISCQPTSHHSVQHGQIPNASTDGPGITRTTRAAGDHPLGGSEICRCNVGLIAFASFPTATSMSLTAAQSTPLTATTDTILSAVFHTPDPADCVAGLLVLN